MTVQVAKGFIVKGEGEKAKALLDSMAEQGETSPYWHRKMNLYYHGLGDDQNPKCHQDKALALARAYRLNTWAL